MSTEAATTSVNGDLPGGQPGDGPSSLLMLRLSLLMLLQFFVWGVWSVTLGLVLERAGLGRIIADAFSVGPIASIVGSFVLGMVLTRYVQPRLLLGALHLLGSVLLVFLPPLIVRGETGTFVWLLLAYTMLYMPTVGLANNVALHALGRSVDRFPLVRAFGTIGWIVGGLFIGWMGLSASANVFHVAAAASVVLGLYGLTLPVGTPDRAKGAGTKAGELLGLAAFGLMRDRSFLAFVACATLISIPLAMYYAYASPFLGAIGFTNVSGVLALGQMSELGFMFAMPALYRRVGIKPLLLIAMLAWAARYALFAIADGDTMQWAAIAGVVLHGVCYDFFFVAGAIYVSTVASPRGLNAPAQGLLTLFTYGVGMLLGSQIGGLLYARLPASSGDGRWAELWAYPAAFALLVALLFHFAFKPERIEAQP